MSYYYILVKPVCLCVSLCLPKFEPRYKIMFDTVQTAQGSGSIISYYYILVKPFSLSLCLSLPKFEPRFKIMFDTVQTPQGSGSIISYYYILVPPVQWCSIHVLYDSKRVTLH